MYEKVSGLVGKRKRNRNITIKKADGTIAMEAEEVKERWSEYIRELFNDDRPEQLNLNFNEDGPAILRAEVEHAIKEMKPRKAMGEDGIAVEMLRALEEFAVEEITTLANKIYDTGEIPESMCKSIFIALPKIQGTLECCKHRTISIMSQVTKIILKIILKRIRTKIQPEISQEQYGFRPGKGTRNAIFTLRTIAERAIEVQKDLYVCFIDYEKAFDKVRHEHLLRMLNNLGIDGKDLRLISNLYWKQKAAVRISDIETEWQNIERGVRQGCVLSPELFNLYSEIIIALHQRNGRN